MKKVCIIGNGIHARQNIIPSLKEIGVSISAIASEYLENQKEFDGIKAYSNYKEMLQIEKPEILDICRKTNGNDYRRSKKSRKYCKRK